MTGAYPFDLEEMGFGSIESLRDNNVLVIMGCGTKSISPLYRIIN